MRYVALGDSYTIGTRSQPAERWPDQLVAALGRRSSPTELVANLGVNGYTSARSHPGRATRRWLACDRIS